MSNINVTNATTTESDPRFQDSWTAAAGANVPARHRGKTRTFYRRWGAFVQILGEHRWRAAEMERPRSPCAGFAEVSST